MKFQLLVLVLAASLLSQGVLSRSRNTLQLSSFGDFVHTPHQWGFSMPSLPSIPSFPSLPSIPKLPSFPSIPNPVQVVIDGGKKLGETVVKAGTTVTDTLGSGFTVLYSSSTDLLKDGWSWTREQYQDAENWASKNSRDIDSLIDQGADVALKSAIAAAKAGINQTKDSVHKGVAAGRAFQKGDWQGATKLAVEAGIGLHGAKSTAFKAAFKEALTQTGQARAAVLLTKVENGMKQRAVKAASRYV